jgi:site-specific recombinase XerD
LVFPHVLGTQLVGRTVEVASEICDRTEIATNRTLRIITTLEELPRRNYSSGTIRCYLRAVADFARYFHRSPDQLRPQHIREYQAYLFRERKLDASSVTQKLAALRFFFIKTLRKPWSVAEAPGLPGICAA